MVVEKLDQEYDILVSTGWVRVRVRVRVRFRV
jgi:hypothetical protein